jgi:hypothetical protein
LRETSKLYWAMGLMLEHLLYPEYRGLLPFVAVCLACVKGL